MVKVIYETLSSYRLSLNTESELQEEIESVFKKNNIVYKREYILDLRNRIDFLCEGVGVEIKINKARRVDIYRQLERYSKFDCIEQLLLVTNRSLGMPEQISGKNVYVLNLGRAWL
jgi:hypothetical protein